MVAGVFVRRLTRFSALVEVEGRNVESFLPNHGRMLEPLTPGAKVVLKKVIGGERKTSYDLIGVFRRDRKISLDSRVPNKLVLEALKKNELAEFSGYTSIKPEYQYGRTRFDFSLTDKRKPCLLEVKSCTKVKEVIASPITVTPGETVHINVTVQNQGDYIELFNVTAYYSSEAIDIQPVTLNATKSTDLRFEWNTTGATKGDYIISAEASTVTNETDTTDNVKASDNSVTVLHSGHDIAIVKVNPSKTVVGQGHSLYINVTCKNYGTFTETCNVTAYYNKTAITQSDGKNPTTLSSGDSTTFTIHWNTTGVAKGNYTISAYAVPVPNETDTADNTYIDGEVWVKWPYDVTGDNYCGIDDIVAIAEHFGQDPDSADWNPIYDINCDDYVGIDDIVETAEHFGETDQ